MAEQNERPGTFPAEGRSDVAADLEEERRNAYSAHSMRGAPQTRQQSSQEQPQEAGRLPPVEGRADVAADVEEEQRNAYSTHMSHP